VAFGSVAIGPHGHRQVFRRQGRFKSLRIDELSVGRLRVSQLEVSDSLALPPKELD
jgi:hypothetical protein